MWTLSVGQLTIDDCITAYKQPIEITLSQQDLSKVEQAQACVEQVIANKQTVYGINTGFGALAKTSISTDKLEQLQENIVLSHAVGVGDPLSDNIVRLALLMKINSLAQGHSGIRLPTLSALITLLNHDCLPLVPSKGSVGASGDLAPLAHLSAVLLGVGHVSIKGEVFTAAEGLEKIGLKPLKLGPKEGLALLNGTQISTAIALAALIEAQDLLQWEIKAGAMVVEAAAGSFKPFDARIHELRNQMGQKAVAKQFRHYLQDSEINASHASCERVQDPYSLRCQPQVLGACYDQMSMIEVILLREANGVSDNPLIFTETGEVISAGNFHAEPVAMAADMLAVAVAEMGAIAERKIALLIDQNFSGLPAFLVEDSGVNSGFMMAHVTASALASENKALAHPRSVDSMPTSANQEDHVSMATNAALRCNEMIDNTRTIVAIELLAAAQGVDLRKPLKIAKPLQKTHDALRQHIPFYAQDRFFAEDIELACEHINFCF